MKRYLLLLSFLFAFSCLKAQYSDFSLGFKAGAAYSGISNLENMIIPEDYFDRSTYNVKAKNTFGAVAGVFVHFRVQETFLAMQADLTYSMQGSTLSYEDNMGFAYDMSFKYHYINTALLFKAQIGGLSLRAGPRLGVPVSAQGLTYTSNSRRFGEDQDIEQGLKNVLKARPDFSIGVGVAYEFAFNVGIEAMYYFGLSDAIETLSNSYNFVENPNRSRSIQLTVAYTLPLSTEDNSYRRR